MISLHHVHLMATDLDATIAFWCEGFEAEVVHDVVFAGARNVFLRVGGGRIHLYDQPPKTSGQATVHHVGVQTDELESVVRRLRGLGVSVTGIRHEPTAAYAPTPWPRGRTACSSRSSSQTSIPCRPNCGATSGSATDLPP